VHEAQVGRLRDPGPLLGADLGERREHRREGDVAPDVDGAELVLDARRRRVHGVGVGDVHGDHERGAACPADVVGGAGQADLPAGQQCHAIPAPGEGRGRGPADPPAGARHDDDPTAHTDLRRANTICCMTSVRLRGHPHPMDITEVILEQHHEQRRAFAVLDELPRDDTEALAAVWGRL
jgi:hypothetical protein